MTPKQLETAGEAIYGPSWRTPLCADLGITMRTLQRWMGGDFNIDPAVPDRLRNICLKRSAKLAAQAEKLAVL